MEDPQAPSVPPSETSGKAIVALVLAIVGLMRGLQEQVLEQVLTSHVIRPGGLAAWLIFGAAAILVGRSASKDIRHAPGRLTGQGFANAGIALGWISAGLALAALIAAAVVFAMARWTGSL